MRHLMVIFVAGVILAGCALPPQERYFPERNTDPRWGIIANHGRTELNVRILDGSGRPVRDLELYSGGRRVSVGGDGLFWMGPASLPDPQGISWGRWPNMVVALLPPGTYQARVIPFYWRIFGRRADLPAFTVSFSVGYNPLAYYDQHTMRHWGWTLPLNGGDVPQTPTF